jgi:hypothetical protein
MNDDKKCMINIVLDNDFKNGNNYFLSISKKRNSAILHYSDQCKELYTTSKRLKEAKYLKFENYEEAWIFMEDGFCEYELSNCKNCISELIKLKPK